MNANTRNARAAEVAEEYWKTRQAAAALDIHPKSIWRYANRGLLNPVKRSARSTRWRKSEVMKLAAEGIAQP